MVGTLAYLLLGQLKNPKHISGAPKSVIHVPTLVRNDKPFLTVKPPYQITLFADGLHHPRMMAIAPDGDVFVVETRLEVNEKNQPHDVVVLSSPDSQGRPTKRSVWSTDLDLPFGIQLAYSHVYVANTGSIVRWPYATGQTVAGGKPETVLNGIPQNGYRNHWTRNLLFSEDRKSLYLSIGSQENLDVEGSRRAVIEKYPIDKYGLVSGPAQTYASGMRNPIGLAQFPLSGTLWANVAERDYEGDDTVPDYLTSVKPGGFYGWPYSYNGRHHDPRMPRKPQLEATALAPDVPFPSHTTPIDVKYDDQGFYVSLHGSQNKSQLDGYKVVFVPLDEKGKPKGKPEDFVTGWLPKGSNKVIYGRPAGLAVMRDQSLLIADDWGGRIWKVSLPAGSRPHGVTMGAPSPE